jgi:glycosyltransferase involved in cell wall biosynthesis
MKVVYLSNFFNHHQKPLSDNLYKLTNGEYWFVETWDMPQEQRALGYQEMKEPYVVKYTKDTQHEIDKIIMDADVVQYGEAPLKLVKKRIAAGKLVIRDDECRYRSISRFLKWPIYTYKSLFLNSGYLACASAYAPIDYLLSGMNPNRCYKWGYFTEVKRYDDIETLIRRKKSNKILWVGRLVSLKHPESTIYLAKRLKNIGVSFEIDIIGTGPKEKVLRKAIQKYKLEDCIHILGPMPPAMVRKHMEDASIFIFTSDRHEGWGAVLNESLNSACAVVAANNIGSVPYLIEDNVNGMIFKDQNWADLARKVEWLLIHPSERNLMAIEAYHTMTNIWNPENASKNLMLLYEALLNGKDTPIDNGPCSKAPLMLRTKGKLKVL